MAHPYSALYGGGSGGRNDLSSVVKKSSGNVNSIYGSSNATVYSEQNRKSGVLFKGAHGQGGSKYGEEKTSTVSGSKRGHEDSAPSLNSMYSSSNSSTEIDSSHNRGVKLPRYGSNQSKFNKGREERETDEHKISQRIKQIGYGYNTSGYQRYLNLVAKDEREGYNKHPRTPDPYEAQSKRAFDGRIKKWRRDLHSFEDPDLEAPSLNSLQKKSSEDKVVGNGRPNLNDAKIIVGDDSPVKPFLVAADSGEIGLSEFGDDKSFEEHYETVMGDNVEDDDDDEVL